MISRKSLCLVLSTTFVFTGCANEVKKEVVQNNAPVIEVKEERIDPDNKPYPLQMECCPPEEVGELMVKNITALEIEKNQNDLKAKERNLIIDLRPEAEYKAGHIRYAINMPVETFKERVGRIRDWAKDEVIIYTDNIEQGMTIGNFLLEEKFTNIAVAEADIRLYKTVTYTNLTGSEFQHQIDTGEGFYIDSRSNIDYEKAHAKNSINVDYENLSDLENKLPKDKNQPVYLYDYTGDRSVVIAEKLQELGYVNLILSLDGTKENKFYFN